MVPVFSVMLRTRSRFDNSRSSSWAFAIETCNAASSSVALLKTWGFSCSLIHPPCNCLRLYGDLRQPQIDSGLVQRSFSRPCLRAFSELLRESSSPAFLHLCHPALLCSYLLHRPIVPAMKDGVIPIGAREVGVTKNFVGEVYRQKTFYDQLQKNRAPSTVLLRERNAMIIKSHDRVLGHIPVLHPTGDLRRGHTHTVTVYERQFVS